MPAKAAPAPQPPADWLSPADAAEFLGIKPRQLQRREQRGYLTKRTLPRQPTESVGRVEYFREDLEALRVGKPNVHARVIPSVQNAGGDASAHTLLALRRDSARSDPFEGVAERLAALAAFAAQYAKPELPRPWLTLGEAVEYSGLSRGWLLNEAEYGQGAIEIRDMGKHARGGRWRFLRDDLGKGTAS